MSHGAAASARRKSVHGFTWIAVVMSVLAAQLVASPARAQAGVHCVGTRGQAPIECETIFSNLDEASRHIYGPGDTLKLEGGTTFRGPLWFDPGENGTADDPITITSYGTGRARIETTTQPAKAGVDIYDAQGFRISNLDVQGAGAGTSTTGGIQLFNDLAGNVELHFFRIDNVDVSGYKDGISVGGFNGTSGYDDVVVSDSVVHNNRDTGVIFYGPTFDPTTKNYVNSNVQVRNVEAHHNDGNPNNTLFSSGNGVALGSVNHGLVTGSETYENGRLCKTAFGPIGIWAYDSNDITIENNESHHNRTGGKADGGGFDLDHNTSNSVVQYNYSHDNEGSGYLMYSNKDNSAFTGNTIRYNISQNDGKKNGYAGIRFGAYIYNSSVHHNTVYIGPTTGPAVAFRSNGVRGRGITVRNNIFYLAVAGNILQAKGAPARLNMQRNDYYAPSGVRIKWGPNTYSSVLGWSNATKQEKVNTQFSGLSTNPVLVNAGGSAATDYKLQATSPMIDAGFEFAGATLGTRDFFGNPVPRDGKPASPGAQRDIGAHEF